ncbi:MAG: serine/threonine protein phosphatase [Spirochaetales bacterium]|nr:serine/threonine protein phosphatase [Spirochaetales bacterium]
MMETDKTYIIGDIHGCLGMLRRLIKKIDWQQDCDALIFLGDYIDRGEDSKGVIDFLIELSRKSDHVRFLMGNHEGLFLDYLENGETEAFLFNGGLSTLNSYRHLHKTGIPSDHISFLKSLEIMVELDDYYIVHAGLRPGVGMGEQSLDDILWIRDKFIFSEHCFGKKVIFGHTPFKNPLVMDNKIGLDTGAVFGNRLTCLEIPAMKFHSVTS